MSREGMLATGDLAMVRAISSGVVCGLSEPFQLSREDWQLKQIRSLTVADHHSDQASEQSLAASSMVMPSAHPTNSVDTGDEVQDPPQLSLPSTKTVTDDVEDPESDISSVSLVSVPTSDDEDAEWQDTRTHSEPLEYVVLYDSGSDE